MKVVKLNSIGKFSRGGLYSADRVVKFRAAKVARAIRAISSSSKDRRQAFFINKSKKSSSIKAVGDARLIRNFKPCDVHFIKICA